MYLQATLNSHLLTPPSLDLHLIHPTIPVPHPLYTHHRLDPHHHRPPILPLSLDPYHPHPRHSLLHASLLLLDPPPHNPLDHTTPLIPIPRHTTHRFHPWTPPQIRLPSSLPTLDLPLPPTTLYSQPGKPQSPKTPTQTPTTPLQPTQSP